MNEYKFQFIICSNDEDYLQECITYISLLEVPKGYHVDILSVSEASSMAAGYNEGMMASDARYKIYLHQDVFIIYRKFLYAVLEIFKSDEQIGMIGMVGSVKLPSCGIMWYGPREGALYGVSPTEQSYADYEFFLEDGLHEVEAADGLMLITNRDLHWNEEVFDAWDFYDVSQSFEFRKHGYKVVVPEQINPWCKHDDGFLNLREYNKYRKKFLEEYRKMLGPVETGTVRDKRSEDVKNYVVAYHEHAAEGEMALAERIRNEVDQEEHAVYFIGIGEEDTYETCIESFYVFRPDVIITVNGAGFSLVKKNGELLYNSLYCDCIHVFTDTPWKYGNCLVKRMNFTTTIIVSDAVSKEYIERYCENIPKVICKVELKEFIDKEETEKIEKNLNLQPEIYRKISKELIRVHERTGKPYEELLEEYLKKHGAVVSDDEFVDLLIQMKDAAEWIQSGTQKEKRPLISVVIPAYNRDKTLKGAMESVLEQSYTNLELIVADDCSDDNTEALVKDMMEKDSRIKYIKSEKNRGAGGARNMGASIATGEYIAFNDTDSIWKSEKLEKQIAVFEENPGGNTGLVFHAFTVVKKDGRKSEWPFKKIPEDFNSETMLQYLLMAPLAGTPTMMIPMKVWKDVGGFDERYRCLEDYELSLRIAVKYRTFYLHEPLITDYYSEGSVNQNWKEGIKVGFYILEEFAEQYRLYEILRRVRIYLMWNTCKEAGGDTFFREQFRAYAKAMGEDLGQLGRKMKEYVEEYEQTDTEWDIFE